MHVLSNRRSACDPDRVLRRAPLVALAVALGAGLLAVPGVLPDAPPGPTPPPVSASPVAASPVEAASTEAPSPAVPPADAAAGILEAVVPQVGTGATAVVAGSAAAPGAGPVRTVRVEVEGGLPVDGAVFAGFVLATLNDQRGWGRDGAMTFARTDGDAEIVVVLASPDTSAALCRPLVTYGKLSCRSGPRAVITFHRWVLAHPDYGDDRTGYRHYVVNHEVGHVLGHGHESCPAPGAPAPVMQQQTKGVPPCAPNPWPYP
ncbi:DUF3152 domain-containing protein [Pseudonocardia sp. KRD-169]|uniref:DUF3152 domain-containing protein n=1 Tax=Pseudonocardia abyssalis TaxID=2792008 RepID=A0ABS6UQL6_9PSEU|nr:DUF3152 domain-containing protein [Pseudonocardia abyssalis]MBW0134557.1 DUF3152 domain-containing protein [Pseudonocardia abyssalis]